MIDRRQVLAGGAALAALGFGHPGALARTDAGHLRKPWRSVGDEGMRRQPMTLVAGRAPSDLEGSFLLNGPAKHERGGFRNRHWFDGDGMIHRFRFTGGEATHEGRFIETAKFLEEKEAGRFLYPSFASVPPDPRPVTGPQDMNVANISVIERGGAIWALWEGGAPTAIAPADLSTLGPVTLGEGLEGVPFSAHPRIDRDGTLWGFGVAALSGHLVLHELAPDGTLRRFRLFEDLPMAMVHDFVATERHLVIGFPPLRAVRRGEAYLDHFAWQQDEPRLYLVIDKANFGIVRRYELPPAFVFHHFGAWEDRSGAIHLAACAYPDASWMQIEAKAIMRGIPFTGTREAIFERITLLPDGRYRTETDGLAAEFPVGDPRLAETPHRQWCISRSDEGRAFANVLHARSVDGTVTDAWTSDRDIILGEHVVIPRRSGGAYLVGSHFDLERGQTRIALFDAGNMRPGPLAIWETAEVIPAALHGMWLG